MLALVLCGCGEKEVEKPSVPIQSITLSKTEITLFIGGEEKLSATVSPDDATDKTVVWRSGNESVATVRGGVVSAKSAGETTVTASNMEGTVKAECQVKVITASEQLASLAQKEHEKGTLTVTSVFEEGTLTNKYTLQKTASGLSVSFTLQEFALVEEDGDGGFRLPENDIVTKSGSATFDSAGNRVAETGDKAEELPKSLTLRGVDFMATDAFSDPAFREGTFSASVKDPAKFLGRETVCSEMKVEVSYTETEIKKFTLRYKSEGGSVEIVFEF